MLTGQIIATVSREPITGQGKNGKDYTLLKLSRKVRFGDKTYDRYYDASFGFGNAVKDAARCQVGDVVAIGFDDAQADVYTPEGGKARGTVKLNGIACTAITGANAESTPTRPDTAKRQQPTEEQLANRTGGSADADTDVPF